MDFYARHGRLPKHTGDVEEKQLAVWLYYTRTLLGRGALSAESVVQLDEALGDWRMSRIEKEDASWAARFADLAAFVAKVGRLPRTTTPDDAEYSLSLFMRRQRRRSRAGTLPADRRARLDDLVPGWDEEREPYKVRAEREHRAASWERMAPHAPVILAGLASGRSPAQMSAMTGVSHQLMFGLARHNPTWADQLEDALIQGRNPALEHGMREAYRHGCRCGQCRALVAGYRQPGRTGRPEREGRQDQ